MNRTQRVMLQYSLELGGAAVLFVIFMAGREPMAAALGRGGLLAGFVLAAPVVPLWLMFAAIVRHYRRADEYQRLQFLKASTLAGGVGLFAFASLPFLTAFGVPHALDRTVWLIVPLGWFVALIVVHLRRRA